jgi:Putative Flp pilus-assembly TadE/G-like
MQRRTKGRRGFVLFAVVFLLLIFLGFLGLVVDLGYFFYVRRQMQKATDAAAIGGDHAVCLGQTSQSQIDQAGWNDASLNGFTDCQSNINPCQTNVTVTINNPPLNSPYASDSRAVEAIINEPVPTLFPLHEGLRVDHGAGADARGGTPQERPRLHFRARSHGVGHYLGRGQRDGQIHLRGRR